MSIVEDRSDEHNGGSSLASRLGVSVDKLDFEYITSCKDVKELEKILKVLRSGEEGTFPHLETKAEERLLALSPKSRLLRKEEHVLKLSDLRPEESGAVADDLSSWIKEINSKDQQLKPNPEASDRQQCSKELPPVRNSSTTVVRTSMQKENATVASSKTPPAKSPKPRDYREWDKVISTLDKENDKPEPAAAPATVPSQASKPSKPSGLKDTLELNGLTDVEKEQRSQLEKEKGNEALRSGSIAEAATYYSRSISAYPTTAAHNNRALAYVKMEKWSEAISDCNYVLQRDVHDIKALLRRATAFRGQRKYAASRADIDSVLALEPSNRQATELLASISKHLDDEVSQKKAGAPRRLVIEETDGEESDTEGSGVCSTQQGAGDGSTPLLSHEGATPADLPSEPRLHNGTHSDHADPAHPVASLSTDRAEVDRTSVLSADNSESVTTTSPPLMLTKHEAEPTAATPVAERAVITVSPLPSTVSSLSSKGGALFKAGQYGDAKTYYDQAIEELCKACDIAGDPKHPYSYHLSLLYSNRAACHFKTGDPRSCISDCAAALELVPHSPKPLLRRAQAYEQLEKYSEAYSDYRHYLARAAVDGGVCETASAQQGTSRCQTCLQQLHGQKWRDTIPKIPSVTNLPLYEFGAPSTEPPAEKTAANTPWRKGEGKSGPASSKAAAAPAVDEAVKAVGSLESYESIKNEGNVFFKEGNYREAIRCYTRGIELAPNLDTCYANRAECYLRLGQSQQAALDASKAVSLAPGNVKALYRHARACKMLGQLDKSRELYEKILQLDRNNKDAQKDLELVKAAQTKAALVKEDKPAPGTGTAGKVHQKQQPSTGHRVKIIETSSDESDTETTESSTGDSSSEANQGTKNGRSPEDASEGADDATGRAPGATDPCPTIGSTSKDTAQMPKQQSAAAALKRGKQHQGAGELAKAVTAFSDAIDLLQGSNESTVDSLSTLYCDRADCHLGMGDTSACLADCEAALKLNPHSARPAQLQQQAEAAAAVTVQAEKNRCGACDAGAGGVPVPTIESSSTTAGATSPAAVTSQQTARELKQGYVETPTSAEMTFEQLKEKGRQLVSESNFRRAVDLYSEGIARFGADAVLHANRAFCHLRLEQYEDAVADSKAALVLEPTNVKALYRLGLAEKHRRNYQESLRALQTVCQRDPNNKEALRERNAVKKLYGQYLEELKRQGGKQSPPCSMGSRSSSSTGHSSGSSNPKTGGAAKATSLSSAPKTGAATAAGLQSSSPGQAHKVGLVPGQARSSGASVDAADHDQHACTSCPRSHRKHNGDTGGMTGSGSSKSPGNKSSASDAAVAPSGSQKPHAPSPAPAQGADSAPVASGTSYRHEASASKRAKITSTSFMQEWHRLKGQRGSQPYAELLRKMAPDDMPEAITNQIDGDMLSKIVCTLKEHFTSSAEDLKTACKILKNISRVSRFNMAKGFLSSSDKSAIDEIVRESAQNGVDVGTSGLREIYGI